MVEQIIELRIELEAYSLSNLESLADVEVRPAESRHPKSVTAQRTVLAVLNVCGRKTSSSGGIDNSLKGVWVQPLDSARLCHSRNVGVVVGTLAENWVSVYRSNPIDETISSESTAEHGERKPAA